MKRSHACQRVARINAAFGLLHDGESLADAVRSLMRRYGISRRQAYRYVEQAKAMDGPIPIGDRKVPFTVKLSRSLLGELRGQAKASGLSLSEIVSQALRAWLDRAGGRG